MEKKQSIRLLACIFITFSLCLSFSIMVVEELLFENEAQNVALQNGEKKAQERELTFHSYLNKTKSELNAIRGSFFFNEYLYDSSNYYELEQLFLAFANADPHILSLKFLNKDGMEVINVARLNKQSDDLDSQSIDAQPAFAVPRSELKDRSNASFFIESQSKPKNEVWYSQIDLNLKNNIVDGYAPTIKIMLPIKYKNKFAGVFVVNHMMGPFLNELANTPLYDMLLFNDQGDILYHYQQKACKTLTCTTRLLGKNSNISYIFPELSSLILTSPQLRSDEIFTKKFTLPIEGGVNISIQLSKKYLLQEQKKTHKQYLTIMGIVFFLSLILTYFIIRLFSQKLLNIDQLNNLNDALHEASKVAKIGFWESYAHTSKIKWSSGVYDIFEVDNKEKEITDDVFFSYIPEEDIARQKKIFEHACEHQSEYFFTHQILTDKGNIKFVEERAKLFFDDSGNYLKSIGSVYDITLQRHNEDCLREQKNELETIFDTVLEGICVLSLETRYEYFNKNYLSLLECSEEELKESNFYDWVTDEGRVNSTAAFNSLMKTGKPQHFERNYITRDGKQKRLTSSAALMPERNQILMTTYDNTKLYNAMQTIREQAITDELTQLYNRKAYQNKVADLLAQYKRYGIKFSMMMLDIDFFKSVNDTYGHQVGDNVLRELGRLIKRMIRECDSAYRIGGEEFIILLPNTDLHSANVLAEKINTAVPQEINIIDDRHITASIGLVDVREKDTTTSLFKRVDDHLYTAKENGRNRVSFENKS